MILALVGKNEYILYSFNYISEWPMYNTFYENFTTMKYMQIKNACIRREVCAYNEKN